MAKHPNSSLTELLAQLAAGQGNLGAPPSPFTAPTAPSAPLVGPTVANAAQIAPQAPVAPQQFDPQQFFGARAPEGGIGLPDVAAAGQIRQPEQAPNALLDLAEREGALGASVTDILSGRETAISGGGEPAPIATPVQPNAIGGVPSIAPPSIAPISPDPIAPPASVVAPQTAQQNAPLGVDATQARLGEIFGEAPQTLSEVTAQDPAFIAAREATASFEQESLNRDARQEQMLQSRAQARQDQRGGISGGAISQSDQADLAKGRVAGASSGDKARAATVAARNGVDLDGQPLTAAKDADGLTDFQKITAAQRQQEIDLKVQAGKDAKLAKREVEFEESRNNVRSTQDSFFKLKPVAEEIAALSGTVFTEGALGWVASKLPATTNARQIERLTTQFEGSAFLQGLIEAKAKGATFGALSEREGDRILAQWGEITDPSSSNPQRITAINNMLGSIQRSAERAAADHDEKFPDRAALSEGSTTATQTGTQFSDGSNFEIID